MSERRIIKPRDLQISEPTCALPGWYDVQASKGPCVPPVNGRLTGGLIALCFAQQEVWRHAQLAPGAPLYNQILILERIGPLNLAALDRSFHELTRRHETLRTTFPVIDGI